MKTVLNNGDDSMQGMYIAYRNNIDEKNFKRRNALNWWDQPNYIPQIAMGYREFIKTAIRKGCKLYFRKDVIAKGKLFIRDKRRFINGFDRSDKNALAKE